VNALDDVMHWQVLKDTAQYTGGYNNRSRDVAWLWEIFEETDNFAVVIRRQTIMFERISIEIGDFASGYCFFTEFPIRDQLAIIYLIDSYFSSCES
jgi:hypothetical protein